MNKQDLLYHYFSNSLTPEQETVFQNLLKTDTEFKAQFEFEKHLKKAIKSHENDRLKSKLQEIESEINLPKLSIFNYRNMAIAASIAYLLVGLVTIACLIQIITISLKLTLVLYQIRLIRLQEAMMKIL